MVPFFVLTMLAINVGPIGPTTLALEPQLAASGSTVALTFGAGNAIYFSESHNAGLSFSAPVKVAEADIVPLTRHRGPRIAFSGGAIVISAVVGKKSSRGPHSHGLPTDSDLTVWLRSMTVRHGAKEA